MTNWWWVRHGPTHAKGMVGWTDLPADLSDTKKIDRLRKFLPDDALVISSPLIRCVATAEAIRDGRPQLPSAPQLREIHFGDWEAKIYRDIPAEDAERADAFWTEPGDTSPPGGESWNTVCTRVADFVAATTEQYSGRNIIAVAHFGVILTQVQLAGSLTAKEALAHRVENLSVTRLEFDQGRWKTHLINHAP